MAKAMLAPKITKKNGELSVAGHKWYKLLEDLDLEKTWNEPITIIKEYKEPNSQSPVQIKNWLFSLGWKPTLYEYRKNTKGEENKVPQVTDKEVNL